MKLRFIMPNLETIRGRVKDVKLLSVINLIASSKDGASTFVDDTQRGIWTARLNKELVVENGDRNIFFFTDRIHQKSRGVYYDHLDVKIYAVDPDVRVTVSKSRSMFDFGIHRFKDYFERANAVEIGTMFFDDEGCER